MATGGPVGALGGAVWGGLSGIWLGAYHDSIDVSWTVAVGSQAAEAGAYGGVRICQYLATVGSRVIASLGFGGPVVAQGEDNIARLASQVNQLLSQQAQSAANKLINDKTLAQEFLTEKQYL
jgi:hypothetical protein